MPPPNGLIHNLVASSSKTYRIWSKLNSFQRAQNRGTVSRPRLFFLIPVAIALGARPFLSRFCSRRSSPRKWDSHLNTLRQSRVGPRDTARHTVIQKETKRVLDSLLSVKDGEIRVGWGERKRETEARDEGKGYGVHDAPVRQCSVFVQGSSDVPLVVHLVGTDFPRSTVLYVRIIERIVNRTCYDRNQGYATNSSAFLALRKGFLSCVQVYTFRIVADSFRGIAFLCRWLFAFAFLNRGLVFFWGEGVCIR